jgi:thiamine-monophosphate kinase
VRIEVDLDALPVADGVAAVAERLGVEAWRLAVSGGEDYELCACGPNLPVVLPLGRVVEGPAGLVMRDRTGERSAVGYQHRV